MTEHLDPVRTSADIKASYRRYLGSLIAARDPKIATALRSAIDSSPLLDKGPYLEATPPYATGCSIRELVDAGALCPAFAGLASPALPLDRPLYRHQEAAIRKVRKGRNVVVATGTGSGKTESFLMPILDSLAAEHERGALGPGVRALLLYPMNALANDQMKRLRSILADTPQITFGRYTGDTESDPRRARDRFEELNPGERLLRNELLSREEMRKTPPNLLLTNYAMLEYLLLRPQDMGLFPSDGDATWRFLVIDEAHVYDGTQGAEIAMLVRRLRDRVAPDRPLQCITTSATVGADTDPSSVTEFASRLFGVPFEWVPDDPARQDLITAERLQVPPGPFWGPLTAEDYLRLAQSPAPDVEVLALARSHGFTAPDARSALAHENSLVQLKRLLSDGPQPFDTLLARVFPYDTRRREGLVAQVAVASAVRGADGSSALSARYHLFLRATEGAFTCLSASGPHVHLARHELCRDCAAPVFELGACKRCGAVHLLGVLESRDGRLRLGPRKADAPTSWLVLDDAPDRVDEDEEAVADDGVAVDGAEAKLCTQCGVITTADATRCADPDCGNSALRRVRKLKQHGQELLGCLVCGARGAGTVRAFETGADAAGAVITTSLYQNLPASDDPRDVGRPGEGRKLLMFSDSRQAAAYFAPYLEDSYGRLQRRRLVIQGLEAAGAATTEVNVPDARFHVRRSADAVQVFRRGMSAAEQERVIAPWIMAEAVSMDDRQSLEGVGLVRVTLRREPGWKPPEPLLRLGLTPDQAWDFVAELVRTLRLQGAVTMPDDVPPNHDIFAPRLGPIYARLSGPEPKRKVLSWLPGRGSNRRVDYATRVLAALRSNADPGGVLNGVWRFLTDAGTEVDWLASSTRKGLGAVSQIDHRMLRFALVDAHTPVYQCSTCQRVAPVSVAGVCPALGCSGELQPLVPPPADVDRDHYRAIYRSMLPVPLAASEHTAQWRNTEAARIQQDFIRGEINALSCSTTFELGVDVGELQSVMLRNMPPTTANYVQRAGRAGRRAGAAALVVTYAQRRSHDLTQFAAPEAMMTGRIRAPYVPLDNDRIDRRHAHSVALAAFFRWYLEHLHGISRKAGEFFIGDRVGEPPVAAVRTFLDPVPADVQASLRRVLPVAVQNTIGVDGGEWVPVLLELLEEVRQELAADVSTLRGIQDEAVVARNFKLADRYEGVLNTILGRDLLGHLANHNVIPKYGFPVDSVELRTDFSTAEHFLGAKLDLSRDLSQAIHEYAPDASLVAGGLEWTSRGIYRLPGKQLVELNYRVCRRCGQYTESFGDVEPQCPTCGDVAAAAARKLIIPEFGFVAAPDPKRPGARPPRGAWGGATHVVKLSDVSRTRSFELPGGTIEAFVGPRGRLISIADGPSERGYLVCRWCGWGTALINVGGRRPTKHQHLLRAGHDCTGPLDLVDLAHPYETDLLWLDVRPNKIFRDEAAWKSVLYALLEAASETLQISRDDIGGTLSPTGPVTKSLVLFDTVPGGGGNVLRIEERLEDVLEAALRRVTTCECGPETSCYGCLRGYRNQRDHEILSRGAAAELLTSLGVRLRAASV